MNPVRIDTCQYTTMNTIVECCAPILEVPLDATQSQQLAEWFGVLGDPTRLRLLSLIASRGEECAACDLVEPLGVSQPTVSHHLKVLHEAGLVERERQGRWIFYRPVAERLGILAAALGGRVPRPDR